MSEKMSELLLVMDLEEEEDNTDKDSGLDSSEENYMDIEIVYDVVVLAWCFKK